MYVALSGWFEPSPIHVARSVLFRPVVVSVCTYAALRVSSNESSPPRGLVFGGLNWYDLRIQNAQNAGRAKYAVRMYNIRFYYVSFCEAKTQGYRYRVRL
jgi:hypothetical protein